MAYSVGFVNRYIRSLLESDMQLSSIEVEGEVSDFSVHRSGHIYFTLKEENSVLPAVMFKSSARSLSFKPNTGDKVIAKGRITTYEGRGNYQLVVTSLKQGGEGELFKRFTELKERLEAMGMFDEGYKRPIPRFIKTLGVVTSPTGAAIRDIINVAHRRNPYLTILLCPALVQGEGAAESIADAICRLSEAGVDTMIVGRGGGSMEDLWAFNEEIVAQAMFACDTPIISAVGHETNFSISDFVADLRAPTPSAAAELAVDDIFALKDELERFNTRFSMIMDSRIEQKRQKALDIKRRLVLLSPSSRIAQHRTRLIHLEEKLISSINYSISQKREHIKRLAAGLNAQSPAARLSQGYSYITSEDGKNIRDASKLSAGDIIRARLSKGSILAEVKNTDI